MRRFCAWCLMGLVAAGAPAVDKKPPVASASRPNVLFIAIDDLNDWVGCFGGNPQVKTPNFDKFASEGGIMMMNAHAPATVCCPSRSALLTGVHAHKTGVYGNKNNLKNAPKAKGLVTLPEYFSQHGYHSLTMEKIFHRHPLPGDQGNKKSDAGQWAFDEFHKTLGGIGPASKKRPVNSLPNLPNEKPSYHYLLGRKHSEITQEVAQEVGQAKLNPRLAESTVNRRLSRLARLPWIRELFRQPA